MSKENRRRVAEEASRLIVEGVENEYLHAKERAIMMLGLSSENCRPANRKIKEYISRLTREEMGDEEVNRRLTEMRVIALEVMEVIEDCDPYLIGSTLTGKIRRSSDVDIHAYCDNPQELEVRLSGSGYEEIDCEIVENMKGEFVHLKWLEEGYPVEITIYPWSWRDIVPISSVTQKPMERLPLDGLKNLLRKNG